MRATSPWHSARRAADAGADRIFRSPAGAFALIFILSFAVRAALLVWWADSRSGFYRLGSGIEDSVAASLLRTGRFADPYLIPSGPTAHPPPLWPAVLALIYHVFGTTATAGYVRGLVAIASYSTLFAMLPWFGRKLGLGTRSGVLAGVVGALIPRQGMDEIIGWGVTAHAAMALGLLTVAFLHRWSRTSRSVGGSLLLGLGCGAAFHVSPPLLLVVVGNLIFEVCWTRDRRRWLLATWVVVGAIVACAPWTWRHYAAFHQFLSIRGNFGLELRIANHPGADADAEVTYARQGTVRHPSENLEEARLVRDLSTAPFFSADGKQLAFFARGRLWRLDLPGGVPVDLAPAAITSMGGSWSDAGQIVYTPSYADALWTITAEGGQPRALTKLDGAAGELSHRWPCVLPGGAGVLFAIKLATNETLDDARIAVADPGTGGHRVLIEGGSMPRYLDDGRLLFARAGKLYAVAFDLASRSIRGAPVPVLDGVATGPNTGAAWYDVTRAGTLAYVTGGKTVQAGRFSWEGPGRPTRVLDRLDAGMFGRIRLSRDATRAVIQVVAANDKLWLLELEQMNATRLTSGGGNDRDAVLSPDGRFMLYSSDRAGGDYRFYRIPLNGSAPPELLLEGNGRLHSISYPARMLGFTLNSTDAGREAYVVAVAGNGAPTDKPILVAGGSNDQESPTVSADGTLVAYQSSESGRREIYVARLADPGSRRRVTNDGGWHPLWSRDGKRLFYVSHDRVVSVTLRSPSDLRFDAPQVVTGSDAPGTITSFDVAPDSTSVLVGRLADPLMLRRDIRLWPGWGKTLPPVE